jgi:hypothetical protein
MTRRKAKGLVGAHCMEPSTIGSASDSVKGCRDVFGNFWRRSLDSAASLHHTGRISMRPNLTSERISGTAGAPGCGLVVILLGILPR